MIKEYLNQRRFVRTLVIRQSTTFYDDAFPQGEVKARETISISANTGFHKVRRFPQGRRVTVFLKESSPS